ncbi:branched-subunit amino acid transport protein [Desulfitispora alkaliphila]|uniref:AzlD domain-containing protein n=1 Tax=Desulfitispora alkaliphila TaxID=622674 RepID=UPI003D1B1CA1
MDSLVLLVIGMGLVTYIPRMLPLVYLKNIALPPRVNRFLEFVPYAVLTSLIFPGILFSVETIQAAIVGGALSVILALMRFNLIIIIIGGILGVFITENFLIEYIF